MPSAYAPNSASPRSGDPARMLVTTIARNGAIAQLSDVSAYAAPNSTMDGQVRVSRGATRSGPGAGSRLPASSQHPASASSTPSVTVSHGSRGRNQSAAGATASPNAPNTSTYPRVSAAVAVSARPTAPRPPSGPATSSDRYAGSIAKPHGLTAPSMPAVRASSSAPVIPGPASRPAG